MKNNWVVQDRTQEDLIDQLLVNRGVSLADKKAFLNPNFSSNFCDSSLLPDFDKFAERVQRAVSSKEKVGIYADYDADGIPGAAFLYRSLCLIGLEVEVYIPSRDEGYGLNERGLDHLKEAGCSLIITVDLGIKNHAEVEYAKTMGLDIIITDHHLPAADLPDAFAVINPKIEGSKYPFKELSGAGVAYKLIFGLGKFFSEFNEKYLKWSLDLIAISTISDVVPLTGENRVIAKFGLIVIAKTKNLGLKKLIDKADLEQGNIGAFEVGYAIAPRINAPGRIAEPKDSFLLLSTTEEGVASNLAEKLDLENINRQKMMEELLKDAIEMIEEKQLYRNSIIVIAGDWQKGIIGPCASRLVEKYSRPTIIFSHDSTMMTGSARSLNDIDIIDIIKKSSKHTHKFGGHKGAAGLSVKTNEFTNFKKSIEKSAGQKISAEDLNKKYYIDAELSLDRATLSLVEEMRELEPFGLGNRKPLFLSKLVGLEQLKFVGKTNNHLSSFVMQNNSRVKSIYFNCPHQPEEFKGAREIDLIYYLDEQEWNGRKYLQMKIVDLDILSH